MSKVDPSLTQGVIDRLFTEENDSMTPNTSMYEAQIIKPIHAEPTLREALMKTKLNKAHSETGWKKVNRLQDLP